MASSSPALAASWETSADGLTWTFHLSRASSGTTERTSRLPMSKFLEECVNPKAGGCGYSAALAEIVGAKELAAGTGTELPGVTTPDPLTVVMKTTEPNAPFLDSLSGVWIIQQASVSKIPLDGNVSKNPYWTTPGQAVGTGPFKISGYQQGTFMELSRFDQYWRGAPKLDKIIRKEYKDSATALLALDKGEVDLAYVTADEVQREQGNTSVRVIAGDSGVDNVITFNPLINPVFDKVEFRQAMAYAIDRQTIIDTLYNGKGKVLDCLYGNPAYTAPNSITTTIPTWPSSDPATVRVDMRASGIHLRHVLQRPAVAERHDCSFSRTGRTSGLKVKIHQIDSGRWASSITRTASPQISFIGAQIGPDGNIASTYFIRRLP